VCHFIMNNEDYVSWKIYISEKYPDNIDAFVQLEVFKDSSFPLIFDLSHLSLLLGINKQVLSNIINSTDNFYRKFKIAKRIGGEREIASPYPVLKHIQRWILQNILEKIYINECATGFIKKKSILENVNPHLAAPCVLKLDLLNFFPSINLNRVFAIFKRCGYSKKISYFLSKICCLDDSLPQGACTSPYIANIVAKKLDSRLFGLANKFELSYTRYADDLTISGKELPWKIKDYITLIIREEGFFINESKTRLIKGNSKKIVTGISISAKEPKLPRKYKHKLRHEAFVILNMPIEEYKNRVLVLDPVNIERIIGKYQFWFFIEKDNIYVKETLQKLKVLSNSI
jgi:RNA-directed DNA polymerase